jgi:3-deoxy-D-manno-octulosonic-acid transferase
MIFLYDLILSTYSFLIKIAAFFGNEKARLWCDGRKDIFQKIETQLLDKQQDTPIKTIWFHVSSLGEFEQGRPIIEALKDAKFQMPNANIRVVLTFFSPSGFEMRKNYPLVDHVFYLPIDNSRNARRFLALIKPDLVVFVKYEFWFHYLTQLQKLNTPILLVSAIFRAKQFSKWNPYSGLLIRILKNFTKLFLQDNASVELLKKHDINNTIFSGDTRVDRVAAIAEEGRELPIIAQFVANKPCFIGGSTWEADEQRIVSIFKNPKFKDWLFIFAPHDISANNINRLEKLLPEKAIRYSETAKKLPEKGISRFSGCQKVSYTEGSLFLLNDKEILQKNDCRILIIDNIGLLSALYRYGKIAYIGGGFGSGIHNTLEPLAHGLPVLFGPKYEKFTEAILLVKTGGGFVVNDGQNIDNQSFETIMERLLIAENYEKAAFAARDYIAQNSGATLQVLEELNKIIAD